MQKLALVFVDTPSFCFQATFGKLLPELAEIFNNRSRFRKPYRPTLYRQYVCNTNLIAHSSVSTMN